MVYGPTNQKMRFLFAQSDLDSYEESLEWITFVAAQPADSRTFVRCQEVRTTFPTNPEVGAFA